MVGRGDVSEDGFPRPSDCSNDSLRDRSGAYVHQRAESTAAEPPRLPFRSRHLLNVNTLRAPGPERSADCGSPPVLLRLVEERRNGLDLLDILTLGYPLRDC